MEGTFACDGYSDHTACELDTNCVSLLGGLACMVSPAAGDAALVTADATEIVKAMY